ncbi:MAG: glycerate kinase [Bacilli bacterium]|nr:glycerate kinase [Bacilli bacterium]
MKVLSLLDSFKGTYLSSSLNEMILSSLSEESKSNKYVYFPSSDGGEGFLESIKAVDPSLEEDTYFIDDISGKSIAVPMLYDKDHKAAYLETATFLHQKGENKEKNALLGSSYGLGLAILDLEIDGYKELHIGLGGTALIDGGAGLLSPTKIIFTANDGQDYFIPTGSNLHEILEANKANRITGYQGKMRLFAHLDCLAPLTGPEGAALLYGPQKGLNAAQCLTLDEHLREYERLIASEVKDYVPSPGDGAAGGVGFALNVLGAKMELGSLYFLNSQIIQKNIDEAEYILLGEGRLDKQSFQGKIVGEGLKIAKEKKKKVILFVGSISSEVRPLLNDYPIAKIVEINPLDIAIEMFDFKKATLSAIAKLSEFINSL